MANSYPWFWVPVLRGYARWAAVFKGVLLVSRVEIRRRLIGPTIDSVSVSGVANTVTAGPNTMSETVQRIIDVDTELTRSCRRPRSC
jgi:hypothetical protein